MGNDALDIVPRPPYLGVELRSNLKWTNHVNNVVVKANNALWFLHRILGRRSCPTYVKGQMYFALVRPHLEFACAVWDPHNVCDIHRLEAIQRRVARFVSSNYEREMRALYPTFNSPSPFLNTSTDRQFVYPAIPP